MAGRVHSEFPSWWFWEPPEDELAPEPAPAANLDGSLKIVSYDLNLDANQKNHRTDEYENKELVVRRGQVIKVDVTLNRDYDVSKHKASAELKWGNTPKISDGSLAILPPLTAPISSTFDDWGTLVKKGTGSKVSLSLYTKADSLIGRFNLVLYMTDENGRKNKMVVKDKIFLLFNPWSKDDDVYLSNEAERQEYVLNDQGMYFYGAQTRVSGAKWYMGQYEDYVVGGVLDLLRTKRTKPRSFGNPIEVSRMLSALINSNDDNGMLVGNWSGEYSDGTEPTAWTGSAAIFKQYTMTKKPVKYAQCWVFANVLTTALRALGIPARPVCNTASAHDTDGNCIMDYHFDSDGKPIDSLDDDSVWNFHCWTDVWMARPDLPSGYGGWQAVDATPQERSDGAFQMGPAPLAAIKAGHVQLSYDTKFVFAEVNACKVKWKYSKDPNEPPTPIDIETDSVGILTVTKAVGKMEKHIISDQYKQKVILGSNKELLAIYTVEKYLGSVKKLIVATKKDVELTGELPEDVMIGKDFELVLRFRNTSKELRNCVVSMTGSSVYYTGVRSKEVVSEMANVPIKPSKETVYRLKLVAADYLRDLVDHAGMRFDVTAVVAETNQTIIKGYDFKLTKPTIKITAPSTVEKGSSFNVKASFTNPMPYKLQNCFFSAEGSALAGYKRQWCWNINGNQTVDYNMRLTAKQKVGKKEIIISFSSTELIGVIGDADITIQ
ncbi:hemocyte protein-glutamine gamma-glutamyltransferase-like [Antedon mediterranea]|uniref:hemocyte protein-glutamine gamma-glutamyltransferase-like n=1 Tax=Antedon mediterranea TaxID=105859 RepID=UPI003AF88BD9